jgi:hypothetical protein
MIAFLGVFCMLGVFFGGAAFQADNVALGVSLTTFGSAGLGMLVAAIQSSTKGHRFEVRDGLNVRQLKTFMASSPTLTDETKVYVGNVGLHPAAMCFECILDGGRTLVIERKAEPGMPAAVAHDLF